MGDFHPLPHELIDCFGEIDVYLFDQILRGRFTPDMSVLDAGCGSGRNLVYFLRAGFDVYGIDADGDAVATVRASAARMAPDVPADHFRVEALEDMSFANDSFDRVIANAILHFATDVPRFDAMVDEIWRVLRPGGILFARLASSIGIEDRIQPIEGRRHLIPDGSERFLVDESFLESTTSRLGGTLLDPIKTVVMPDLRSMTNWCIQKVR